MPPDCTNMRGMFEIHKKDRKVTYLKAPSRSEMIKWIQILKGEPEEQIDYTRNRY